MILVTGGAGFIGSALIWALNQMGYDDILVVDDLGEDQRWQNLAKCQITNILGSQDFLHQLHARRLDPLSAVFHMGACSSTTETDADFLIRNNLQYSIELFRYCTQNIIPFFYASSAATYGSEEAQFSDDPKRLPFLRPINKYGFSKHVFDQWALKQKFHPPCWAGLKFFNVYGPNEYHKGAQASVAYHALPQVLDEKTIRLFKSYRTEIPDGQQKRDFIYIKDVTKMVLHFFTTQSAKINGIYNIGTGRARSFADLAQAIFTATGHPEYQITYIDMPESLQQQYQYFTQADLGRLRSVAGYDQDVYSLEEGVADYYKNYLLKEDRFL